MNRNFFMQRMVNLWNSICPEKNRTAIMELIYNGDGHFCMLRKLRDIRIVQENNIEVIDYTR